jgi:beta-N-acetylhexosaminidase
VVRAGDHGLRRLVLSSLLLGYVGPTPPRWLLDALRDGLGGVVLFGSNVRDGVDVRALTDRLRDAAGRDVVIATDEEGGDVTRLDDQRGSASPGAAALGFLDDVAATEEVCALIGARLARAGITVNLAPVADVNVEARNPVIGVRSFGADAAGAARHAAAAVRGIQRAGTAACVKHFPGHGASVDDSHHGVATLRRGRDELEAVELEPFRAAIAAGTRAVMTGHLLVPALDPSALATISRAVTSDLLRGELGFAGTVVTDALEMKALNSSMGLSGTIGMVESYMRALIAGADAIETGALDYPELLERIPAAVAGALGEGRLTRERLEDAGARTAQLAGVGDPGAAAGAGAADGVEARCLEVLGTPPVLTAPLVIECRPPGGMASGELPWSLAGPLAALLAGTDAVSATGPASALAAAERGAGRSLVVVVRDPLRHPWQRDLLRLAAARGDAVIVDVGWPVDNALLGLSTAEMTVPLVRTRGVAPGLLAAAAALLARDRTPDVSRM